MRAESELENCRKSYDEKKRALAELEQPARLSSELEAEKARLDSALAAIGAAVDLDAMAEQHVELKQEVSGAENAAATARTAAGVGWVAAKRDTVVGALPEALRTPEAVAARRAILQGEQSRLVAAQERAAESDRAAAEGLQGT